MKRRLLFLICIIVGGSLGLYANIYKKYDVRSGMSGNCVRGILQDSIGYMWFATQDGLNRFNGIEFTRYGNIPDSKDGSSLNIVTVCAHKDKRRIWVASHEKLYLFDPRTERFEAFSLSSNDKATVNSVFGMAYDNSGRLWMGTNHGLFAYDESTNTLRHYVHSRTDAHTIPNNHIWTVYNDSFGTIWIGTRNGLGKYNAHTDNFTSYRSENTGKRLACNEIISLVESTQGTLYAGTWFGGLAQFNKETGTFRHYFAEGDTLSIPRIRTIFQRSANSLFLGSDDGLYTFNMTTKEGRSTNDEQSRKSIYAIYQDREGGVWIGSYFNGVSYLSPKHNDIEWYCANGMNHSISGNVISQFCEAPDGNIWIATEDGGLNLFHPSTGEFTNHFPQDLGGRNIHALLCDGDNLWIGSFSKGLYIWNTRTGRMKNYRFDSNNSHSIPNDHIYTIYRTKDGTVYIGTLTGFCRYCPQTDSFDNLKALRHTFIYDMVEDTKGFLWLASKRDGIWKYNPRTGELRNYRHSTTDPSSPGSNWVVRAYIDHQQNLWFCTDGGGVCRYDYRTDSFQNYTTNENLPNNVIYGILDDQSGNYWLSSNKGLIRFEPKTRHTQLYTMDDGLQSNQFNFRSSMEDRNGKFYFGGVNGFNCFYPFRLSVNKVRPVTSVSSVYLHSSDDRISHSHRISALDRHVVIPAQVSSFDIMFECLSYVAPSKNMYAYKLDGIHDKWVYTDKHYVSFLNLPPGQYTFRVKSGNNDGYWSEKECCLSIRVLPSWWKTPLAKTIYILIACALIYLLAKRYVKKRRRRQMRKAKEEEQTRKQELYQAKIAFFTQMAHEIKTPLCLIKAPLEAVIEAHGWNEETENNLLVIQKNTNRLTELIRQLLDFRKIDKEGYKLSFQSTSVNCLIEEIVERFRPISLQGFTINLALPERELTYNLDKEALTKIVTNLLTNAVKYGKTRVNVTVEEMENHTLRIRVSDDGPGIPPEERAKVFEPFYRTESAERKPGVGIGLSLVKLLVEKHDGKVYVNPDFHDGCELCVEIPSYAEAATTAVSASPEEDAGAEAACSLLIVEDTKDMREFLFRNLSSTYRVYTASNGKEALELLEKTTVNLIISDIVMPQINGFELLKAVRADRMLCHIPVILLSAIDNVDTKIEGLDNGADAYIEKPFSMTHIKATINNLLESRRMLYEHFTSIPNMSYDQTLINKSDAKWIDTVNEIITSNLTNENFSIEKLAEEMAISRSNLQRKLKGLTGMPPNDYIRLVRLKTAGELLAKGEYRINEVCYIVGFNSPSYFARCFQKQFGILPKDYCASVSGNAHAPEH